MHGNLWEWCADPWHHSYIGVPQSSYMLYTEGSIRYRVARGSSWHEPHDLCRSATRLRMRPDEGNEMFGFCGIDAQQPASSG